MDGLILGLFSSTGLAGGVAIDDFLLRLLVAFLVGQLIGWAYGATHSSLSYSQTFVQSLVLLSMVVCVVMGVVGDSLARAFGLGAALAIVRFRTPVKDSRDTVFLFLSVAAGMASGAGQPGLAVAASLAVCAVAYLLHRTSFGMRSQTEGMLRFRFAGGDAMRNQVDTVLKKHCSVFKLSAARVPEPGAPEELIYDVDLRSGDGASALLRDLLSTGTVTGVSLLPLARAGEG